MFSKILIANRGEIAVRILRACRDLDIPAVVAYSEADHDTLAVRMADEAICIGPSEARKSYLNQPAVVSAAVITGCDAVHPGYGFLSEDAGFAEVCAAHDLAFIGPRAEVLERFSSKYAVRRMLAANGLPTVPGSRGIITDLGDAMDQAQEAGYPVLLKPSAGGGGRGMRLVRSPREMETSLPLARSEAQAAFGDDSIYFEKWIEESRHVEVQVLVDQHGNGVHLGERDCSIQRRHQKIIEEAPSPAMDDAARERLRDLAIRAVVAAGYESAGTLEFLLDKEGSFYFIEINCRIQVEHPVTEMLTGLDLIAEQIRLAAGERLAFTQEQVAPGWPCHRVPDQRRGSRRQLLAADRRGRRAAAARRAGRAGGHAPVSPATRCRRSTTRCWPSWWCGATPGRWRWRGRVAPWPSSRSAA